MGIAVVYAAYLAVSIGLTVAVASALSRSGRVYLAGVFGGDEGMATAVNRMLVVGFCLLSLGYAVLTMRTSADIHGPGQAVGVLSVKVGEELLVLGGLHLVNMMVFTRFRRRQGTAGYRPAARRLPGTPSGPGSRSTPGLPGALAAPQCPGVPGASTPGTPGGASTPGTPATGQALGVLH
jgi:hypothetical protein